MSEQDILTPELAERLETLLVELRAPIPCTGQEAASLALQAGIGIVDARRRAFLVDITVYAGAQFRLEHWKRLALARDPVPMVLFCPRCGTRHIDQADPANGWLNEPHRSHLCASCGNIWRPADVATVGVAAIATRGRLDVDPPARAGGLPFDHADLEAAQRALKIVRLLANTEPEDWRSKSAIHAELAEFKEAA